MSDNEHDRTSANLTVNHNSNKERRIWQTQGVQTPFWKPSIF